MQFFIGGINVQVLDIGISPRNKLITSPALVLNSGEYSFSPSLITSQKTTLLL